MRKNHGSAAAVDVGLSRRQGAGVSDLLKVIRLIRSGGVPTTEFRTEGGRAFSVSRDESDADTVSKSHANATRVVDTDK